MGGKARLAGLYFLKFLLWSSVFYGLYVWFFPSYSRLVLLFSEMALDGLFRPIHLFAVSKGIVLVDPQVREPIGLGYDLFSIGLNAIFAPALVLTTLGYNPKGVLKALASIGIMALLHSLHVLSIIFYFLIQPENTLLPVHFPSLAIAFIRGSYTFFDKMAYALFPFLAWLILCFGVLSRWMGTKKGGASAPPSESP